MNDQARKDFLRCLGTIALLILLLLQSACTVKAETSNGSEQVSVLWYPGEVEDVCMYHQFSTVATKAGTVLVFAEGRIGKEDAGDPHHICEKRSTDGGMTWETTRIVADAYEDRCSNTENETEDGKTGHCYANPTPVIDENTGRIFLFYAENFNNDASKVYYKYSDDEGGSWSQAYEITSLFAVDPYGRKFHLPGPGHGIQLKNSASGRLIVTVWHRLGYSLNYPYHPESSDREKSEFGLSVLYSDDGGQTWKNSYLALDDHANEGRIAEMPNGTVVINARSVDRYRYRLVSMNAGETWSESALWESIGSYGGCDSGFFSDLQNGYTRLLTTHIANDTTVRNSLWIYLSYDEGNTWAYQKELWSDPDLKRGTGASDMTLISDGVYGIVHGTSWDETQEVRFISVKLSDLIGTEDETQVTHTHLGGTATCIQPAICAICAAGYGEINPNAHYYDNDCDTTCNGCGKVRNPIHSLELVPGKKAMCTDYGWITHYTCPQCQRIYADANGEVEMQREEVLLEPLGHRFVLGICTRCGTMERPLLLYILVAGLLTTCLLAVGIGIHSAIRRSKRRK